MQSILDLIYLIPGMNPIWAAVILGGVYLVWPKISSLLAGLPAAPTLPGVPALPTSPATPNFPVLNQLLNSFFKGKTPNIANLDPAFLAQLEQDVAALKSAKIAHLQDQTAKLGASK